MESKEEVLNVPSADFSRKRSSSVRGSSMRGSRSSNVMASQVSVPDQIENPSAEGNNKELAVPKLCECAPDLYNRFFGLTPDEAILTGLQTVIDLCGKLRTCKEESEEEPERDDVPERDSAVALTRQSVAARSQTDQRGVRSSTSQTVKRMVSAGFQVNPNVKQGSTQTSPLAEMVSEILQTVGLTPEMATKVMQTSFIELPEDKKASLASIFMQTSSPSVYSELIQTISPELRSGFIQTSESLLPRIVEAPPKPSTALATTQTSALEVEAPQEIKPLVVHRSMNTDRKLSDLEPLENDILKPRSSQPISPISSSRYVSRESSKLDPIKELGEEPEVIQEKKLGVEQSSKVKEIEKTEEASKGDEHKCIAPPEPPPVKKICKCCKCRSSADLKAASGELRQSDKKEHKRRSKESKLSTIESAKSTTSLNGEKQLPLEVKYAITKISKYKEFTTFEIMRSTKHQPKQMPKSIEGVFVLKKKEGVTKSA